MGKALRMFDENVRSRLTVCYSGMIDTPMSHAARLAVKSVKDETLAEAKNVALKRKGKAEEVAELIAFLLGDGASYITGNAVSVDGGWQC